MEVFLGQSDPLFLTVEVKIIDETGKEKLSEEVGEILVRGKTVMQGYWNLPKETAKTITSDGWLKTGDLGHLDKRKPTLYLSGKKKRSNNTRRGKRISTSN